MGSVNDRLSHRQRSYTIDCLFAVVDDVWKALLRNEVLIDEVKPA